MAINYTRFKDIIHSFQIENVDVPTNDMIRSRAKEIGISKGVSSSTIAKYRKRYLDEQTQSLFAKQSNSAELEKIVGNLISSLQEQFDSQQKNILEAITAATSKVMMPKPAPNTEAEKRVAIFEKDLIVAKEATAKAEGQAGELSRQLRELKTAKAKADERLDAMSRMAARVPDLEKRNERLCKSLDSQREQYDKFLAEANDRAAIAAQRADERYDRLWADCQAQKAKIQAQEQVIAEQRQSLAELQVEADRVKKANSALLAKTENRTIPMPDDEEIIANVVAAIKTREDEAMTGKPYTPTPPTRCCNNEGKARRIAQILTDRNFVKKIDIGRGKFSLMTGSFYDSFWSRRNKPLADGNTPS